MYYPYFISYMVAGLAISLVVFIWALNNGQFKDQQRARYLPLKDETDEDEPPMVRVKKNQPLRNLRSHVPGVCRTGGQCRRADFCTFERRSTLIRKDHLQKSWSNLKDSRGQGFKDSSEIL